MADNTAINLAMWAELRRSLKVNILGLCVTLKFVLPAEVRLYNGS
jgi:hypothetical protein